MCLGETSSISVTVLLDYMQWAVKYGQVFVIPISCVLSLGIPHISSAVSMHSSNCMYIYFSSGGSCSYSSVGSPGGGGCTVCSHLAPAEVSFTLYNDCHQWSKTNDSRSVTSGTTGEQNLV